MCHNKWYLKKMFSLAGFLVRLGAGWNTEIKKNYLSQKERIFKVNI